MLVQFVTNYSFNLSIGKFKIPLAFVILVPCPSEMEFSFVAKPAAANWHYANYSRIDHVSRKSSRHSVVTILTNVMSVIVIRGRSNNSCSKGSSFSVRPVAIRFDMRRIYFPPFLSHTIFLATAFCSLRPDPTLITL